MKQTRFLLLTVMTAILGTACSHMPTGTSATRNRVPAAIAPTITQAKYVLISHPTTGQPDAYQISISCPINGAVTLEVIRLHNPPDFLPTFQGTMTQLSNGDVQVTAQGLQMLIQSSGPDESSPHTYQVSGQAEMPDIGFVATPFQAYIAGTLNPNSLNFNTFGPFGTALVTCN